MTEFKFPKIVALIQRRDRSQWEIGEELLRICGAPPIGSKKDGGYAQLDAVANEIETLKIEGYTVSYLAKMRIVSHNFPSEQRAAGISWNVHYSAGTPDMLNAIIEAAGKKPVTTLMARKLRNVINDQQQRRQEKEPGRKTPPRKTKRTHVIPTKDERKGLALIAEVLDWLKDIKAADKGIIRVTSKIEKNLDRLVIEEVDYLVDSMLTLAEHAREGAEMARKLRANKRSHLTTIEGGKSHG